ncbi:RNA polymerase sigma factor [Bosea sp. (in: a-proteobacteria)]|uniref:RNA polymerase sigma factor n=1 Tax=Bosea sp. (in: a-proteobacteria) TaxID=1871050 RepID=UPI002FC98DA0
MSETTARAAVEAAYRGERRRVLATLIRLLGGFEAAEEALHEAFAAAAERWPREGVPANPYAWLVSAGRFRTIDRWRRQARLAAATAELAALADPALEPALPEEIQDDELRLIFTCCHPALPPDAQIALTLREVGGLTTEEIARAYLTRPPVIGQRIVRAKAKIRDEALPYEVPGRTELPERLQSVLRVIYLVFNEGYAATAGPQLTRQDLCAEAIRLARLLTTLLPDAEAMGLLALMLLHEARRTARTDAAGDIVLLDDQDRSLWDRAMIAEAAGLIELAFALRSLGPYLLQAAIAATHAEAESVAGTDWNRVVGLYDLLLRLDPSPVAALNRAAALSQRDGAQTGLAAIEAALRQGGLETYPLAHAARADLQRRLGLIGAAQASYRRAIELTHQPAERRFLERQLRELAAEER